MKEFDTPITTISGIGPILGAVIMSEIGDISRFQSANKLAAFAGIDPIVKQKVYGLGLGSQNATRGKFAAKHAPSAFEI